MKHPKHTGSIREYVKELPALILEIPNVDKEDILFNFMDNLQGWAEQELRQKGVQDIATAMAITKSLVDFRRRQYCNDASLKDNHDTGGEEEVPPNVFGERRAKCYNQDKGKGKQREFTLRLSAS